MLIPGHTISVVAVIPAKIGVRRLCWVFQKQFVRKERKRREEKISLFAFFAFFADCFCFCSDALTNRLVDSRLRGNDERWGAAAAGALEI
ncbi:MAG: hypothetical protein ACREPY_05675 [Rhodanobacteraceae bacterium]